MLYKGIRNYIILALFNDYNVILLEYITKCIHVRKTNLLFIFSHFLFVYWIPPTNFLYRSLIQI